MATKQARKESPSSGRSSARTSAQSSPPSGSLRPPQSVGTDDPTFNLVSVLYHAMQGAETASRYLRDAQGSDQTELAAFFQETQSQYEETVARAKSLLATALGESEGSFAEDDQDDDDDDDE